MKNLRTKLALKIAPWLKPGEPVAREWKISGIEDRWGPATESSRTEAPSPEVKWVSERAQKEWLTWT